MKALAGTFNKEKAQVGASQGIVIFREVRFTTLVPAFQYSGNVSVTSRRHSDSEDEVVWLVAAQSRGVREDSGVQKKL